MIGVLAVVAVVTWRMLDVLAWVGGRGARRVERWLGVVFAATIFVPIYFFHDATPLMAVARELARPIAEMVNHYAQNITRGSG